MAEEGTLGQYIRAARLGYHWLSDVGRYVRVTPHVRGMTITMIDADSIPKQNTKDEHVCWWESDGASTALAVVCTNLLATLPSGVTSVVVDDNGTPIDLCRHCGGDGNGATNKTPGLLNYVTCSACDGTGINTNKATQDDVSAMFRLGRN